MSSKSRPKTPRRGSVALAILSALATGALRITAGTATSIKPVLPTSRHIHRWIYDINKAMDDVHAVDFEKILRHAKKRRQLARAIQEIQRRRFARIVRQENKLLLEVTEEGKKRLVPYSLKLFSLESRSSWDGMWRIVLFDIPEKHRVGRDTLRRKLQNLGFFQLQKSAFVYPYPCLDQLDVLIHSIGVKPYVTFFESASLGYHEAEALNWFKLSRRGK